MLKGIVEATGVATLLQEHLQPEVFGSAWAIYWLPTTTIRLLWDGKDGWGLLQIDRSGTWVDIGPSLSKSDLAPAALHETANMKPFREEIARFCRQA